MEIKETAQFEKNVEDVVRKKASEIIDKKINMTIESLIERKLKDNKIESLIIEAVGSAVAQKNFSVSGLVSKAIEKRVDDNVVFEIQKEAQRMVKTVTDELDNRIEKELKSILKKL
jgi:hypothetical protein